MRCSQRPAPRDRGGRVPLPMRNWTEGPLTEELLNAVRMVGYEKPMPIQMQAVPIACAPPLASRTQAVQSNQTLP